MGGTQSASAGPEATRNTAERDAGWWIDFDDVRETLLGCVDPNTGALDVADLLRLEHAHNHRLASDAVALVKTGSIFSIIVASIPGAAALTTLKAEPYGRLSITAPKGYEWTWTRQEVADAIAAASSLVSVTLTREHNMHGWNDNKACSLWARSWLVTATAALWAGPGPSGTWTADRIDRVGTVLRALTDLCAHRERGAAHARSTLPGGIVPVHALDLAYTILGLDDDAQDLAGDRSIFAYAADAQEQLRGMLSWIDAMERTDVLFEHVLKSHQAERIERMMASDSRFARS